jgi:putative pyrroloquinoline-quinone binding quinoprotein
MKAVKALAVVAGAVLASCSPTAPPPPLLEPLGVAGKTSWSTPAGMTWVDARGDVVLAESPEHLALLDAKTGDTRWQLDFFEPLPGETEAKWSVPAGSFSQLVGNDAVLTGYNRAEEQGLVLLSAKDGSVRWRAPVQPLTDGLPVWELRAADDHYALVEVKRKTRTRTVAFELTTGEVRWQRDDVWPVGIAGDHVIGATGAQPGRIPGRDAIPLSTVTVLDLATGEDRWDLADRYSESETVRVGGDTVLVRAQKDGDRDPVSLVLDLRDGRELLDLGRGKRADECETDGRLVACAWFREFTVADVASGKKTVLETGAIRVSAVVDGRIFVSDRHDRGWTIDTAGNVIDDRLPGDLVDITDDQAFFLQQGAKKVDCRPYGR